MDIKHSYFVSLFQSKQGYGFVLLSTWERTLWCCLTQQWKYCQSIKLGLRVLSTKVELELYPVFVPFNLYLLIRPSGWVEVNFNFELRVEGGFSRFKIRAVQPTTETKDLIDRGRFYHINTAPWAKGGER